MSNFETFEQLWRQQTVVVHTEPPKIHAVRTAANRVTKSRGRLLRLGVAVTVFSIFVSQFLTVVNYVHGGRAPTLMALAHLGLMQVFQIGFLIALLRRLKAHRLLRAKGAASVRENLKTSLGLIEAEMRDYRLGLRLFSVLLLLDLIPVWNGYQQGYFDGVWAVRGVVFIIMLGLLMMAVCVRHYRRVLRPQRQQLNNLLGELDAE